MKWRWSFLLFTIKMETKENRNSLKYTLKVRSTNGFQCNQMYKLVGEGLRWKKDDWIWLRISFHCISLFVCSLKKTIIKNYRHMDEIVKWHCIELNWIELVALRSWILIDWKMECNFPCGITKLARIWWRQRHSMAACVVCQSVTIWFDFIRLIDSKNNQFIAHFIQIPISVDTDA